MPLKVHRERHSLSDRSRQIPPGLAEKKRCFLGGIRISRIPEVVAEIIEGRAVKLVRSGLGEDLDPTVAQRVIFRRKRVGVDANLTNRLLGRKLACCKAVNEKLSSIRPGRR